MTKSTIKLRPASLQDYAAMETVDPLLATGKDRGRVVRELMALGESWVAEADGVVTGFAIASHHFFARPFVDLLVVADDRRRLGIGTALMGACEAAHDDDRMFTSTNESNAPMRALLAQAGWQVSGVVENLDPGDPELVFVKFRP